LPGPSNPPTLASETRSMKRKYAASHSASPPVTPSSGGATVWTSHCSQMANPILGAQTHRMPATGERRSRFSIANPSVQKGLAEALISITATPPPRMPSYATCVSLYPPD
jgi:hypothetical protein